MSIDPTAHVGLVVTAMNRAQIPGYLREDLMQESMATLTRAAQLFDPDRGRQWSSYAYAAVRNTVVRHRPRQDFGLFYLGYIAESWEDKPLPDYRFLYRALEDLPQRTRHAVVRYYALDGLGANMPTIARELGVSKQRVSIMLKRALELLRESLATLPVRDVLAA